MVNGWFVFAVVASIVVACGFVLAVALMRAAWTQRERESLTANDLRALEESALLLVDQIKSEADAAITEIDKRRKALSKLIKEADERIAALAEAESRTMPVLALDEEPHKANAHAEKIMDLASTGMAAPEIAKATGVDCAEVNLILSLHKKLAA